MDRKTILFSKASVKFKAPEHTGITEYDNRSAEEYQSYRKEYDPPADDSEKLLAPWKKRLGRRQNDILIHAAPETGGEFLSLKDAQDKVRSILSGTPDASITVLLHNGIYPFHQPLEFSREDSGSSEHPVLWLGESRDGVIFKGSAKLSGFRRVTDESVKKRLHPSAAEKILTADLTQAGIHSVPSLPKRGFGCSSYPAPPWLDCFVNGKRMTLARWPKKRDPQLKVGKVFSGSLDELNDECKKKGPESRAVFEFRHPELERWREADDIRTDGQWGYLWASDTRKVEQIDYEKGTITLAPGVSYGCLPNDPFYFFNLLEELSDPGEWYLDRKTNRLYCIPEEPVDFSADGSADFSLELSLLPTPFLRLHAAEHIVFRNIRMSNGASDAIYAQDCRNLLFTDLEIAGAGGSAILIEGGDHCGIFNVHLHELGAGGVRLSGGERKTLTRADHFAINIDIHDFSQVDRCYTPAASVGGCGNHLLHFHLYNSSHHGISVSGDLQTVAYCDGHDLVRDFDDQAGIDCFFDPFMYGTRYLFNFWHDLGSGIDFCGQAGIRLDDMISNILIYGNVFLKCAGGGFGGVQIHAGKNNIVENNLFIDCIRALSFSCWGKDRWEESLRKHFYANALENGLSLEKLRIAPRLANVLEEKARNFVVNNYIINCGEVAGFNQFESSYQYLGNNLCVDGDLHDLGFADPDRKDFSLAPDSILLKQLPFQPIPFHKIGIDNSLSL